MLSLLIPVSRTFGASIIALSLSIAAANAHTWTSAQSGKTLEADFVKLTETAVIVKIADGAERTLPLDSLIEEDRIKATQLQDKADGFGEEERPELPDDDGPIELLIQGFHICCSTAEEEFTKAVGSAGSVAKINKRLSQATLTASSSAAAQKAIDTLVKAGFHGDLSARQGSTDVKFYTAMVRPSIIKKASFALPKQVCCERAASTLNSAILDTSGVKDGKVSVGSYDFTATGEFDPDEIITLIRAFGYSVTRK